MSTTFMKVRCSSRRHLSRGFTTTELGIVVIVALIILVAIGTAIIAGIHFAHTYW